jgi:hypothetical protein
MQQRPQFTGRRRGAYHGDQTYRTLVDAMRRAVVVDQRPLGVPSDFDYIRN